MSPRLLAFLLSGAALFATALPAAAIQPNAAADALGRALTSNTHNEAKYAAATQDGSNIVIKDLTITHAPKDAGGQDDSPEPSDRQITFAETVIESPSEGGGGIFQAPKITFSHGTIGGKAEGAIGSASLSEVTVFDPSTVKGSEPAKGLLFHTAEAKDLSFAKDAATPAVTVGRIYMETGHVVNDVPQDNKGSVEDIAIPPEMFADSGFKPESIGYDKLTLGLTWDGSRDPGAKTLTVRNFTLSLNDGGAFSINGQFGNLPAPAEMNDPGAASKASQMQIHDMTLRYQDQSLAGRILDMLAKQQGISRADYAKQISGALPFLLAALNNPAFQNQVAGAVGTFLQDPKSLTVKLAPKSPITGAEIMKIAGSSPQTLPDRLNASVTANTAD
jgi:hypothetical protein